MTEDTPKKTAGEEVKTERVSEPPESYYAPLVDISETDEAIIVEADVPGVDRSAVEVKIDNGLLSILGRVPRKSVTGVTRLYEEFTPADYYRAFSISEEIDESRITAICTDGVLTVTLPKAERARVQKIKVK